MRREPGFAIGAIWLLFGLAVLALTALVAIAAPAWKATRIDPVVAVRSE